ncbi:OmpA family protein [Rhizobium sp. NFR03]|uniref:OmpA family protein n=1 Tax=Rhizobium sp. NFR03 TaxID=1566263 RepID=UPI0008B78156|nr:OmpA family protein [Rhizobium sp. NFR03]SES07498.1 Outer membrane protein OmpA [Rhizobium sp. NFR03]
MTIRSKLFATVAMPLLTMTIGLQPALADAQMKPFQVAQADPEEDVPKKRRPAEAQQDGAPQQQAEPSESGEGRPSREERRKQRDAEQQSGGEQPQREAQPQGEDSPRPSREERRKQREAEQQNNEQAAPDAQPTGEDTPRPSRDERRKQREAEQQKAREQAQPDAEAQPAAEPEGETPRPSREERRKQREERQKNAEQPAAQEPDAARSESAEPNAATPDAANPDTGAQSAEERKRLREERRKQREADKQNAQQPEGTQPDQQATPERQPGEKPSSDMTDEERARIRAERRKQREAEGQQAEDPARPGAEPNADNAGAAEPGSTDPAQAGDNGANRDRPARDVVDKRSREEREKLARDPSKSDETVVLPVENGAAVLDSDKDADNRGNDDTRDRRRREREQVREERNNQPPPRTDADAQSDHRERRPDREELNAAINERGRRIERAPEFDAGDLIDALTGQRPRIEEQRNNRTVLDFGDEIVVRSDDRPRLRRDARETYYEELPRGRTREVIERPNGMRVVTIYNRYGDVIQRTRINRDGEEYLMVYAPEVGDEKRPPLYDAGEDLPPMRLTVPVRDYIIDTSTEPDRDYYDFLAEPPVERVERTYSLDEVRNSARIRDKVRRIDLDTITFATGSAEVPMSQAKTLRKVADAMLEVIDKDPGETFLIEGHTDAVGSDQSNLVLSDERAESVAALLTDVYEIPPENLVTQGYGERFLKVRTSEAEQENRRVTIRRVTPLVRPVAQK